MEHIAKFEGELPGNTEVECGNYLEHDVNKAKEYAKDMYQILKNWQVEDLTYKK